MTIATSLQSALAAIRNSASTAEREAEAKRGKLRVEYLRLIARADRLKPEDEERLVAILPELGIDADQAQADADTLRRAAGWNETIGDEVEIVETYEQAIAARSDLLKRHKAEVKEADAAVSNAGVDFRRLHDAKTAIRNLAKDRPDLFAAGVIVFPSGMAMPASSPQQPQRTVTQLLKNRGTAAHPNWEEPALNSEGTYTRNGAGLHLMSDGSFA